MFELLRVHLRSEEIDKKVFLLQEIQVLFSLVGGACAWINGRELTSSLREVQTTVVTKKLPQELEVLYGL